MPKRSFWRVVICGVLLAGFLFMITGYDAGLPLHESVDERHNLDEVYTLRGIIDDPLWKPGYPPGILYLNYGAQLVTEALSGQSAWEQACQVILNVRATGIFFNLITALLIAVTARRLAGDAAGLLAALVWLFAPRVLQQTQFGFPQVYENFFYVLALFTAILAVEKRQGRYALLSVLAGLGAVIFKYVTFPVLGLGVGAALWNLRFAPRRWRRVLVAQFMGIGFTALALVLFGGVDNLAGSGHVETNQFLSGGLSGLLDPETVLYVFENAAGQIGLSLVVFFALLMIGTLTFWPRANTWQRLGWLGALGLGFSHTLLLAVYLFHRDGIDRNLLSSSGVFAILTAVSVMSATRWLSVRLRQPAVRYTAAAATALLWLTPQTAAAWDWIHYRSLPITYAALVDWTDTHLPQETLLVNDNRPFIRDWNCENHSPRVLIWDENLLDLTLEEWLERDVYYAVLSQTQVEELQSGPAGRDYLSQMTLVQQFPPPDEIDQWRTWRRGDDARVMVYQLWPREPEYPANVIFGDEIQLAGGSLETEDAEPGGSISLQLYWKPLEPPHADYNLFVHLTPVGMPDQIIAQDDGPPSQIDLRTTSTWDTPGETFISDEIVLQLPDTLEPGLYRLRIGLYDWRTGQRLLTESGKDSLTIPVFIPTSE